MRPASPTNGSTSCLICENPGVCHELKFVVVGHTSSEIDAYCFASEIAWQASNQNGLVSLDEILCDPTAAATFDRIAARYAPGFTPFEYRWAALWIRKRVNRFRKGASTLSLSAADKVLSRIKPWSRLDFDAVTNDSGVYIVQNEGISQYVGVTLDLRNRLQFIAERSKPLTKSVGVSVIDKPGKTIHQLHAIQSRLISVHKPVLNSKRLAYA